MQHRLWKHWKRRLGTLAKRHDDLLGIKIEKFLNNMIRLSDVYL